MITPVQLKMARAAVGLSQAEVAGRAGLSTAAYNAIEQAQSDPKVSTLARVQAVLERKGVIFGEGGS